ncbi:23S rRNA (adenine(2030)-N(6))-methyltransferase RlmJ [Solilutibacter silvestris]|uniref:Ribosomal RNA large subunit methyltransferase J n=1 Tax=Solilutibacter silvestris TaxID=1645665 RepID=A0A2K1Q446_9GAMM|nr:23S rRNA (adenine(2030)-N(6))-methyltransferase RlmJ [Lysobacter silvestris]PNS09783.1 Protein involved in catabolism of external DNA [Lysobacter silvestris]
MNYRHAFHAGNHADVLKHVTLLALCDALTAKPTPCFALDTHAGVGLYRLQGDKARKTAESDDGIARLRRGDDPLLKRYLAAVAACRTEHGADAYPGSPWLLAHALREQDRIACCELHPEDAAALAANLADDPRVAVHARDGYAAIKALLPPRLGEQRFARGLVLIDPPFEAQLDEFDHALAALRTALERWPQGMFALWYPIKQARALHPFYRSAALLQAKSALRIELCVRADDSPLRLNGSGMLILNAPWQFDARIAPTLRVLESQLADPSGARGWTRLDWLRAPA